MFKDNFHHDTLRKYVAYVAAMFSNVYIDRNLDDGTLSGRFRVPLHYAKMEHALERVIEDPTHGERPEAIVLPALSYDLVDFKYAGDRHQPSRMRTAMEVSDDPNKLSVLHAPVPYDFHFRVCALVKNVQDAFKIVEATAPYFSPDYTAQLELVPEMGITTNTPVVLESSSFEFDVPQDYKTRVSLVLIMDLVLQGYLYGPVKKWPIIKFANVGLHVDTGSNFQANQTSLTVTTQPGLTANGAPTDDINSSVDYLTIKISDDYGYVETINTLPHNIEQ